MSVRCVASWLTVQHPSALTDGAGVVFAEDPDAVVGIPPAAADVGGGVCWVGDTGLRGDDVFEWWGELLDGHPHRSSISSSCWS